MNFNVSTIKVELSEEERDTCIAFSDLLFDLVIEMKNHRCDTLVTDGEIFMIDYLKQMSDDLSKLGNAKKGEIEIY